MIILHNFIAFLRKCGHELKLKEGCSFPPLFINLTVVHKLKQKLKTRIFFCRHDGKFGDDSVFKKQRKPFNKTSILSQLIALFRYYFKYLIKKRVNY